MHAKTPSSLKWLIGKQARLAGQIFRKNDHVAQLREQITAFEKEIAGLHEQKRQIEAVMQMHEVRINAEELRPIRPQHNSSLLGYGGLTRLIYRVLRKSENGTATTRDIVAAVFNAMPSRAALGHDQVERVKARVRVRLCIMAKHGLLMKCPARGPGEPCSWHLAMVRPPDP
jgi:hypothetical protein